VTISAAIQGVKVCDLVNLNDNWTRSIIEGWLHNAIVQKITVIMSPNIDNDID